MTQNNIKKRQRVYEQTIILHEKELKTALKKNRIVRALYATGGTIALALGILGVVVPGLPTTPLVLLAAALYAKSSKKLYKWLLSNKFFGPRIKNYQRLQGVTRKGKFRIILLMCVMVLVSTFLIIKTLSIRIVILSAGFIGIVVVCFFVPTAKEK